MVRIIFAGLLGAAFGLAALSAVGAVGSGGLTPGTGAAAAPTGSANLSSSGDAGSPFSVSSEGGLGGWDAMKQTVAARPEAAGIITAACSASGRSYATRMRGAKQRDEVWDVTDARRRVGQGALAPCPRVVRSPAWARFALPTYRPRGRC